jgi:hypothetical protein
MSLFDNITRHDVELRRYAEPEFPYLNSSAREGFQQIREMLDSWFDLYPAEHKVEIRSRFRSRDDSQYRSAFFELFLHELLLRVGDRPQVHPALSHRTRRPDFLVESQEHGHYFLEATLATDETRQETAARARLSVLFDSINGIDSPNFYIGMDIEGTPATSPSGRRVRAFLELHLRRLDPDHIAEIARTSGLPRWRFEHDGCTIWFYPIPKGPDFRGRSGIRPIGLQSTGVRCLETPATIRAAILEKAGRYGDLEAPYIIAVNVIADLFRPSDVAAALFGDEALIVQQDDTGRWREGFGRSRNGAWVNASGPRYTRVSAVLVCSELRPSNLHQSTACVYHNPWAERPYIGGLNLLTRVVPNNERECRRESGQTLGHIFGLPSD